MTTAAPLPASRTWDGWLIGLLSAALVLCAHFQWLPISLAEALGFATGAVCVWLVTKGNVWNWPIGIANNIVFAVLFWKTRLYGDFGLQWVYFVLGLYGWWQWLRGGENHTELKVSHTSLTEWIGIAAFIPLGTWGLKEILLHVNGSAPWLDSFTTILSLAAQYLMCRKSIESWYLWILADLIYVPLYIHRDLNLTAALYAGFLILCIVGLRRWRNELVSR